MGAYLTAPFAEVAPYLADYGYHPVPIRPGAKAPMLDDWQAGHPVDQYLRKCASWGTGILTRTSPAIDLDIRDREVVRVLIGLAGEMLGPSPFRIGAPPKALLPLSTAAPFEKISGRWWALPGENWQDAAYAPHRIEILCDGQQYIAYARHPRGTFYRWARGEPMDTYRVDLPEIDQAKATAFLSTAETVLRDVGAVPLKRMNRIYYPDLAQPERQKPFRRRRGASGPSDWQLLDPETLAKRIDAKHARRLRGDGWITSCPAHNSGGHRSLSITPREGGGSVVHCFADCSFVEVAREIGRILGAA